MSVIKLTQALIDNNLRCPDGKSKVELVDREMPGMYLLVSAANPGHGTFFLRYKDADGKTCHQKIGRTIEIDLAEARRRAKKLKAEIQLGADPRGEAKVQKQVPTLDLFMTEQYLPHAKQHKRSWKRDEELYVKRIKPVFGHKRLNELTRQKIANFHIKLRETNLAPASCDHYLKLLKHALNLALDWGALSGLNPAARIPLFRVDNKIENYLDDEQLQRLLTVLRDHENRGVCTVALFLLSTGARCNEALSARWEHVDTAYRVWRIPATNSKSTRVRSVPLNDSALEVLKQIERKEGYVFVNGKTRTRYTTIAKSWERLRASAGLPHLRLHDLRHQFASMLVNSGRSLYEVQQILGHSDMKVTERYAHLSKKTLQDAANSASLAIRGATAEGV
jgi:integrase